MRLNLRPLQSQLSCAVTASTIFAGVSSAQAALRQDSLRPAIAVSCTGGALLVRSVPNFVCSWSSTNAAYVLIVGYSMKARPAHGKVTFSADSAGPFFFVAVGDSGTAMTSVGRSAEVVQHGSQAALEETWILDRTSGGASAPYRVPLATSLSAPDVAAAAVHVLQQMGFDVAQPEAEDDMFLGHGRKPIVSALVVTTNNSIIDASLCDSASETDCRLDPRQRRIWRRVSLVIRVSAGNNGVVLAMMPVVLKAFRRSGTPFLPDDGSTGLAVPFCDEVAKRIKTLVGAP
jgi:hypothetical protein